MRLIGRSALFAALTILGVSLALLLGGCTAPLTQVVFVDGVRIVEHIDYTDTPCENRGPDAGCYQMIDGVHHVWRSGVARWYVFEHEYRGHAIGGMQHMAWVNGCTTVTVAGYKYKVGQKLCITRYGEVITDPLE